jgi:hypothetical protein
MALEIMNAKNKGNRAKREKLFSEYSNNLSFYKPELMNQFLCPVCEKSITKADLEQDPSKVALAHVIPKSIGGRIYALACKACDNRIGCLFDKHLSDEIKSIENPIEQKGIYGSLLGTRKHGAILIPSISKNNINYFEIRPPPNFPRQIWNKRMEEISKLEKFRVEVKFNRRFDPDKRNISHLYSAFLLMFSTFGYEYVLSPNVDPIQSMFMGNNSSQGIHKLVLDIPSAAVTTQIPSISIIREPKEIHTYLIILPSPKENRLRCVFLPGFGKSGEEGYRNLLDLIGPQLELELGLSMFHPLESYKSHLKDVEFTGIGKFMWDAVIKMADNPETGAVTFGKNFKFVRE